MHNDDLQENVRNHDLSLPWLVNEVFSFCSLELFSVPNKITPVVIQAPAHYLYTERGLIPSYLSLV